MTGKPGYPGKEGPPVRTLSDRIRCLIFWPAWTVITIVMATVMLLMFWAPAQLSYNQARHWSYLSLKLFQYILGIRYRVVGAENLEGQDPCVVVANHESSWETQAMTVVLPRLAWVIKYELLFVPFFGQVVFLTRPIMLKRSQKYRALSKMLEQGRASLREGRWVSIFPQGTRQHNVARPRFHTGAATLAVEAGCKLLPVVHNSGRCWGSSPLDKCPGLITITIGKPIETLDERGQPRPVQEVHQQMGQTLHRMRASLP